MIHKKNIKKHTWVLWGMIFLLFFLAVAPQTASAGVCGEALEKCMASALLGAIFSLNVTVLAMFSTSCLMGYSWCLRYYLRG